VGNEVEERR
jgi:transcriptional regulator with XRE-family HTH domain